MWEKKSKGTTKCDKRTVICDVGTANVTMKLSNVRGKKKETTKYDKRTVTCDIGIAQCEDETVKCEKKVREPPNVRKELSYVMFELHNVKMKPSNVIKK